LIIEDLIIIKNKINKKKKKENKIEKEKKRNE